MAVKTCGDWGGKNVKGKPCKRARAEKGPCPEHLASAGDSFVRIQRKARQDAFLAALPGARWKLSLAARMTGITRQSHHDWLKQDPSYAERYHEASEDYADRIRLEIDRRGFGFEERETRERRDSDGNLLGVDTVTRRRSSDALLGRLAEAHLPEFRKKLDVNVIRKQMKGKSRSELVEEVRRLLREVEQDGANDTPG